MKILFKDFIENPDKKVFLVIGQAGGGKSIFTKWAEKKYKDAYEGELTTLRIELCKVKNL